MPIQFTAPRWVKGALVAIDLANQGAAPVTIPFQYNPESLSRNLTPRAAQREAGRAEALGFAGAPNETFTVKVRIDATIDAALAAGAAADDIGIHHLLAALEVLLYPRSEQVSKNDNLLKQGQIETGGGVYDAPLTLFVWGPNRVLPVQLTSVDVTEELFDADLNPLRADLTLKMSALSYSDLDPSHKGYKLFLTYQKNKEQMASRGVTGNAAKYIGAEAAAKLR
ncbi:hypothetical protein [Kouleothrix sp.]|uniref:CIS tube protein n=1 Tax=Kouleothrix sp. TaxID=2779161 RepID=UPI00391A4511